MGLGLDESQFEHVPVRTNGVTLHTVQAGPANGRLLILLHGFPEFWYGWRAQIGYFANLGWRVVAPDQRGYNLSDKPAGVDRYAVETLAADVVGLIQAMGQDSAWLVGHDWGAAVAWETALRYPERVQRLGILNVPHPGVMTQYLRGNFRQMLKSWYIFYFQIPGLPEWMLSRNQYAGLSRMLRESGKTGTFQDVDMERYIAAWSQPGSVTAMLNWYRSIFRSTAKSTFGPRTGDRRVVVPTLILWGRQDVALSAEMAQRSADLCVNGRLVYFDDATHWVQHDEPVAVNAALADFLVR